jgi:hypothetical protein
LIYELRDNFECACVRLSVCLCALVLVCKCCVGSDILEIGGVLAWRAVTAAAAQPARSYDSRGADGLVRVARRHVIAAAVVVVVIVAAAIACAVLLGVLAPELVDELTGHQVTAVHGDQPQHKAPVLLQVAEHKVLADELAQVRLLLHELDAVFDVLVADVAEEDAHDPGDNVVEVNERNERQPEPHEHEDLLVEEVYRKHALNCVRVHLGNISHLFNNRKFI